MQAFLSLYVFALVPRLAHPAIMAGTCVRSDARAAVESSGEARPGCATLTSPIHRRRRRVEPQRDRTAAKDGRSPSMANKDKGGKSSKTAASKTLKEKRAAKAAKKGKQTGSSS